MGGLGTLWIWCKIGFFIAIGCLVFWIILLCIEKSAEARALELLGISEWQYRDCSSYYGAKVICDEKIRVKSSATCMSYDKAKFFKENEEKFDYVKEYLVEKCAYADSVKAVLESAELKKHFGYRLLRSRQKEYFSTLRIYRVLIVYTSPAGRSSCSNMLCLCLDDFEDPTQYMSDTQRRKYQKEQEHAQLKQEQDNRYAKINKIIDLANKVKDSLIIVRDKNALDDSIFLLLGQTDRIRKIKTLDSMEWSIIDTVISDARGKVKDIIERNKKITDYYNSEDFQRIKNTCNALMESQCEFNDYIREKAEMISSLFGTRVVRSETETNDEYDYIRPYKKSITPFTAEVSSTVFASAENNPLDYVVKCFYTDKSLYPEQIQKLQLFVEELETLSEARNIIENYKKDYQQYIDGVPKFIMQEDEDGFYERLGFANISEDVLTVEYRFSYTSEGGFVQRSFTVPMTEENIVALIEKLQNKLSMSTFAKEQRSLMTRKLRQRIKERDNYTCCYCGNSIHKEPNLLLEIDHILSVAKGGCTVEDNLQTLCWKCNRQKSDKIVVM